MGQRGQLDRIPVAHAGPILSLDWYNPQSGLEGLPSVSSEGWVATGGLDRCVKVCLLLLLRRVEIIHRAYRRCGISTPAPVAMALNRPYTISVLHSLSVASFGDLDMAANSRWFQTRTSGLVRARTFLWLQAKCRVLG
jgi:hypothetical protein